MPAHSVDWAGAGALGVPLDDETATATTTATSASPAAAPSCQSRRRRRLLAASAASAAWRSARRSSRLARVELDMGLLRGADEKRTWRSARSERPEAVLRTALQAS